MSYDTASDLDVSGYVQSDQLIARIYETAVDPGALGDLLDAWSDYAVEGDVAAADPHFERGLRLLRSIGPRLGGTLMETALEAFETVAAFAVNRNGVVLAANPAAQRAFGLNQMDSLSKLPLDADDLSSLQQAVNTTVTERHPVANLLRCRAPKPNRLIGFEIIQKFDETGEPFALVATSEPGWTQDVSQTLRQKFGLSNAEMEVLQGLVECQTAKTIADTRGRSLDTVRSQIRAILNKTETHSQTELVRLTLAMVDVIAASQTGAFDAVHPSAADGPRPVKTRILARPDNRVMAYHIFGDLNGRPVFFLPTREGIARWPAPAETYAQRKGLKVIVPLRAGHGISTPLASDADWGATIAADHAALCDAVGITSCPVLALGETALAAVSYAAAYPDRVQAILLAGLVLPASNADQASRMNRWQRGLAANARPGSSSIPFLLESGCRLARKSGKPEFFNELLGGCVADIAVLTDPAAREAIFAGTSALLNNAHAARATYVRETEEQYSRNWAADLRSLDGKVPVLAAHGLQDSRVPPATLAEYRRAYPFVDTVTHADDGQLIFFRRWKEMIDRLIAMV